MPVDVADGHMAHEPDEADPWHVRALDVGGYGVGGHGVEGDGEEAAPEIEEADDEEDADSERTSALVEKI